MKRILCFLAGFGLVLTTPKVASGWMRFLDGGVLPPDDPSGPPGWQLFVSDAANYPDNTTVVEFFDPVLGATNQALRIHVEAWANEWYLGPFLGRANNENVAGARLRLVDFSATGTQNLLDITTASTLMGPAPSVSLVDGRYKLWNYVTADSEIQDLGPAVSNEWHTAYLWARNDGQVKLWWDGKLVYDQAAPLVNAYDGYMEWGAGSWEYDASATVDFDWVGWGDVSSLPIYLSSVPSHGSSYNTNATFSFTVGSVNGVAANTISIAINGIDRTADLAISGTDASRQGVVGGLVPNQFYHVALTLTDTANNTSHYLIDFDTIRESNFQFEAEDWNFVGGQFIDNPILSSTASSDNYLEQGDTPGVDEHDLGTSGSDYQYRSSSPVGTEKADDILRQNYLDAQTTDPGVQDYNVGWVEQGEWLNYTRTFPDGQFLIYGRLASGNPDPFEAALAKVTGPTTPNQTTTTLGSFKGSAGHGWQVYEFIPLTDAQGRPVLVNLGGVETLRVTATSANVYNANFYLLVPAPILDIALINGKAIVSWQTNLTDYALQSATNFPTANWTTVSAPIQVVNGRNTVTNDVTGTRLFFKLGQ